MSNELSNLPRDVIFGILSRLPTKSLLQFRCVSKSCTRLISNPHFIKLHLSRPTTTTVGGGGHHLLLYYESNDYTKDYYSFRCASTFVECIKLETPIESVHGYLRIVGSSKGLICLFDTNYFTYVGTIFLWNPSIRKFKIVQDSHLSHRFRNTFSHIVVGFGFVPKANDFKLVQILYDSDSQAESDVLVYAVEDGFWRKVGAVAPCFLPNCWSNNVLVNGAVHWMAYKRPRVDGVYNSIMSFDLGDEVFRVMELPRNRGLNYDQLCLTTSLASEGSLSMFFHFRDDDGVGERWDMWLMKDYGVAESWTKQFSIVQPQISLPLCFMDTGGLLLAMNNGKLVSYEPQSQRINDLEIFGLPGSYRVVSYMSSLALLDADEHELVE